MGFDIPMRTRGALDRNSLIQNYGVQGDTASAPQNSASLNNSAHNSGAQQQNANSNNRQNTPPQNNNYNQNQGGYNNQPNNYNQSSQNNYNNQNQGGYNNQPNNYNQPPQNNYNNQNQGGYNNQPNNYNQPPQNNYNNQNQGGYNNQPNNYNQPPQNNYNNQNQGGYNNQPGYNNPNQGYVNQPVNNGYNNYAPVNSGYNQNQGYVNQPVNNGYNNYAPVNSQFNDPLGGIGNTINGFVGGLDNSFNDVFTQNPTPNYGRPQNVDQTADTLGQTTSSGGVYSSRGPVMPDQPMNNPPMNNTPVNRTQPINRGGMTSAQNVVSGGVYQSNSMNNGSAQMQPAAPVKPRIQRQRLSRTGTLLAKGQKVPLKNKKGVRLEHIKICFGWEPMRDNVELDASAFMLGANGKVISDDWFIFYGQPESPDNSVKYEVFSEDPRSPDDASIEINLPKVSADVQKIVLAVTLYEASERRQNFSMVKDMYARITDCSDASETMRFEMKEGYATVTAMVLGELYRHNGEWKFNSVGSGVNKDLADFCGMYGVALE